MAKNIAYCVSDPVTYTKPRILLRSCQVEHLLFVLPFDQALKSETVICWEYDIVTKTFVHFPTDVALHFP